MANTFLAAQGCGIGQSLWEPDLVETASHLMKQYQHILLPMDCVVSPSLESTQDIETRLISHIKEDDKIFDIGTRTVAHILERMDKCRTLLWNGPLGVFEVPPFDQGTNALAKGVANLTHQGSLLSVAGGGDTVAALNHAGVTDEFTYVSMAGGAFLEWLEGKPLPGVKALYS